MKQRVRMLFLFPLAVLTVVALVLVHVRPASVQALSAEKFPIAGAKAYAFRSNPSSNGNLTYHGGPVMSGTANVYLIFWEPTGSFVSPLYNDLTKRYFHDVGSSPLYHNNTQYPQGDGSFPSDSVYAHQYLDTSPYPSNPMTDAQVQAEVTKVMLLKGWQPSLDNIFFVYTAAGEHNLVGDQNNFCAYHSSFGNNVIYAAMIYPTVLAGCLTPAPYPNHDADADSEVNWDSHEQMESATDPLLNAWYFQDLGHEIGDECDFVFGPRQNHRNGDVSYNGHHYLVQEEWDNAKSGCTLKGP